VARPVQPTPIMNATTMSILCPVCGAEMKRTKTELSAFTRWSRFKCTCGHCEDLKQDGAPALEPHLLLAIEGFQEFPSDGT
jgi:hypothetical protein